MTLVLEFLRFYELLDLVHVCEAFRAEEAQLLDRFAQEALLKDTVHQVSVLLSRVKASENLHLVDNFSVLFGFFALELLHLLQVKQASLNDELFAADSLIKAPIVQLNHTILQFNVLRRVIIKEFHVGQE